MALFSTADLIALVWFLAAWLGYSFVIDETPRGKKGLNSLMHRYRGLWMQRMVAREARMMDGQVIASLQNGTAFFASTSLIALGGAVTLLITDAGRHFNRGQRAFFFALGYLGWFIGPLPLIATTAGILVVMWRRQFASQSSAAVGGA